MKIGVYGGSFNPIHKGHLAIIDYVLQEIPLDKLLIIPVGVPTHKENEMASSEIRYKMCKKAIEDLPKTEVSRIEIDSDKPSYTIDTMEKLEKIYPDAEFYIIIGEDSAQNFSTWKNYKKLLKKYNIVILKRRGYNNPWKQKNVITLDMPYFDASSTEIREKIEAGKEIKDLVIPEVLKIINKEGLYTKNSLK